MHSFVSMNIAFWRRWSMLMIVLDPPLIFFDFQDYRNKFTFHLQSQLETRTASSCALKAVKHKCNDFGQPIPAIYAELIFLPFGFFHLAFKHLETVFCLTSNKPASFFSVQAGFRSKIFCNSSSSNFFSCPQRSLSFFLNCLNQYSHVLMDQDEFQ